MNLRPATREDIGAIATIFIETRTRCLSYLNWDYSQEIMVEVFGRQMAEMDMWVAEVGGHIVGFVAYDREEVHHLYVLPEHHGQGFGAALLDIALRQAPADIRLWVFQENSHARGFYEKHGFVLEYETDGQGNLEKTPDARYVLRASAP
ncbi:MAG: GNAT family N-acetyltransferase [Nitrospiraceae bacterium]